MKFRLIALVVALALLAGCFPATPTEAPAPTSVAPAASAEPAASPVASPAAAQPTAQPLTPVTLAMGYIPSVQFAPFYVAQEKGYFEQVGLDVTFNYGMESDLIKLVGTNEVPFMIGSGDQVILGRSQGLPVRYITRFYRKFPVVLFAKAGSGIESLQDLEGKKVGVPGLFGASYVGWQAMVYASQLDPKKVTLQSVGFTQATSVSEGLVDAAMDYVVNGPVQLRLAGQDVVEFLVSDYIDLPSNGIITNDTVIQERPELAQAMATAFILGLRDTLNDPDAAFQASLRAVPTAGGDQEAVNRAIFDESLKLWQASEAELGLSDPVAWEKAATFMQEMGLIQTPVIAQDLYTNRFVER
jgi:NitT/TauT family transport system substrate-binding protein